MGVWKCSCGKTNGAQKARCVVCRKPRPDAAGGGDRDAAFFAERAAEAKAAQAEALAALDPEARAKAVGGIAGRGSAASARYRQRLPIAFRPRSPHTRHASYSHLVPLS